MKRFIWMLCGIFASGLLLGTLSAGGNGVDLSGGKELPAEVLEEKRSGDWEALPFRTLTEEGTAGLGAPRPGAPVPEPLG